MIQPSYCHFANLCQYLHLFNEGVQTILEKSQSHCQPKDINVAYSVKFDTQLKKRTKMYYLLLLVLVCNKKQTQFSSLILNCQLICLNHSTTRNYTRLLKLSRNSNKKVSRRVRESKSQISESPRLRESNEPISFAYIHI